MGVLFAPGVARVLGAVAVKPARGHQLCRESLLHLGAPGACLTYVVGCGVRSVVVGIQGVCWVGLVCTVGFLLWKFGLSGVGSALCCPGVYQSR